MLKNGGIVRRTAPSRTDQSLRTVLEGALAQLSGFLLELLDGTLVDTTALVDEMAGGGRLARVDVSDDWDMQVVESERAADRQ